MQINQQKGHKGMSQTVHPLDDDLVDFAILENEVIHHLGRDGEYCVIDRRLITRMKRIRSGVGGYRKREVAADGYKRNGITRHTVTLFKDAGAKLTNLADVRESRSKIVPFPVQDDDGIA